MPSKVESLYILPGEWTTLMCEKKVFWMDHLSMYFQRSGGHWLEGAQETPRAAATQPYRSLYSSGRNQQQTQQQQKRVAVVVAALPSSVQQIFGGNSTDDSSRVEEEEEGSPPTSKTGFLSWDLLARPLKISFGRCLWNAFYFFFFSPPLLMIWIKYSCVPFWS